MRSALFIQILSLLITFSIVGELTATLHVEDALSLEIDGDNEEENKEDKLKEYTFSFSTISTIQKLKNDTIAVYLLIDWCSPAIDELIQPPELA